MSSIITRPYAAILVASNKASGTLALFHSDSQLKNKWLVDIRRWWRKAGRYGNVNLPDIKYPPVTGCSVAAILQWG
ncbi:MAG: DUF2271 domain-containing protein [Alteromonas sp.]|nr:DUF2271 domain-containing protein [Alteromonas sp.]